VLEGGRIRGKGSARAEMAFTGGRSELHPDRDQVYGVPEDKRGGRTATIKRRNENRGQIILMHRRKRCERGCRPGHLSRKLAGDPRLPGLGWISLWGTTTRSISMQRIGKEKNFPKNRKGGHLEKKNTRRGGNMEEKKEGLRKTRRQRRGRNNMQVKTQPLGQDKKREQGSRGLGRNMNSEKTKTWRPTQSAASEKNGGKKNQTVKDIRDFSPSGNSSGKGNLVTERRRSFSQNRADPPCEKKEWKKPNKEQPEHFLQGR